MFENDRDERNEGMQEMNSQNSQNQQNMQEPSSNPVSGAASGSDAGNSQEWKESPVKVIRGSYEADGSQYNGESGQYNGTSQYNGENSHHKDYHQSSFYPGNSYIPVQEKKPRRKNGTMAKKIAGVTAAALLFGVVSGGTMYGVNRISGNLFGTSGYEEEEQVTLQTAPAAESSQTAGSSAITASPAVVMDVSGIVEKAMPSVVAINNTMLYEKNTWFGQSQTYEVPSSGSGIIIGENDEELLIVTNNHVVQDSTEMKVVFIDDTAVDASIKGTDSSSDLAVIAVPLDSISEETRQQISIATIGDSNELKVGQGVVAIGNALGYGQSVTVGYVSALEREVQTDDEESRFLLQTDAAINPGNSGGALLNMNGELIGINAAKYSSTEVEGMGYAIPISEAQDIINELMNKKTREEVEEGKQGYLGIQGTDIDRTASAMYDMPKGVYVYKITEDGAAANSDLKEKDIITKFDGQTIRNMTELQEMLTYYESGTTIKLTVQRLVEGAYQEREVEITLGSRPQETVEE